MSQNKESFNLTYNLIKLTFTYLGIEGVKSEINKIDFIKKNWYLILQNVAVVAPINIGELATLLIKKGDLTLTITTAVCYGTVMLSNIKLYAMVSNCDMIANVIKELNSLWPEEPHSKRINDIVKKPIFYLQMTTKCLTFWYIGAVTTFNFLPFYTMLNAYIQGEPIPFSLPYPITYPFKVKNILLYLLLFLQQIDAGFYVGAAIAGCDSFLYFCLSNISMQFEILASDLKLIIAHHHHKCFPDEDLNIDDIDVFDEKMPYNQDDYQIPDDKGLYQTLCSYIMRHNRLIQLVWDLEYIFNWTILINIIGSSVMICLVVFQVANIQNDSNEVLIEFAFSVPTKIVQILFLCWNGQNLINSSIHFSEAAYSCQWYQANNKFKTTLLYIILRAQRPLYLTAFGFSVVSLNQFSSVIGSSWSYFTLLWTTTNSVN